jgi:hypothetical protein
VQPFYVLTFLAGLLVADLLVRALRAPARLRAADPYERHPAFLTPTERGILGALEEAVGPDFRVLIKVCLSQILRPDTTLPRRGRRSAAQRIRGLSVDFLICSAADGFPLCAVLAQPQTQERRLRRDSAMIARACESGGVPVLRLSEQERYDGADLRRRVLDAVETADVRVAQTPEPPAADEEALLAELAAAMQEPDGAGGRRIRAQR